MQMIYIVGGKFNNIPFLIVTKDGHFQGSENLQEAIEQLPDFNGYHAAGYTWSCSATIFWMQFSPCLYSFANMDEVKSLLVSEEVFSFRSFAGHVNGVKLNAAPPIVQKSVLIDEDVRHAKPFYEP